LRIRHRRTQRKGDGVPGVPLWVSIVLLYVAHLFSPPFVAARADDHLEAGQAGRVRVERPPS